MSNKLECPACGAYLSGVYDAMEGMRAACPRCNLPGSVIRQIEDARRSVADEALKVQHKEALVRAGKAEAEAALLRKHLAAIKKAVDEAPSPPDDEYGW